MAKNNHHGRRRRCSRVSVLVGLKGRRREVWKYIAADKAPMAQLPEQPREVVVEKSGDYRTPEHGFDWLALELPVDAVAMGHRGVLDFVTIGFVQ